MSMGSTIALIKALAPVADPAVVAEAVEDWLDEHPEAVAPIDDTAGDGDTDKIWSADKTWTETSELKEAIENQPETKTTTKTGVDLDIADDDGNVILRLKDGHIQTANFDSSKLEKAKKFGVVKENRFASALTGWTYDNCTANNGLTLETESKAYSDTLYYDDEFYLRGVFEINTIGSVFGLVMESDVRGAIYLVDSDEGTISLHKQYSGSYTPPAVIESEDITFTLEAGKRYILEVHKVGYTHTFTITDEQSAESTSVSFDNAPLSGDPAEVYCGMAHGAPGVVCISGSVDVANVVYSVRNYPKARALFIGDSITEGTCLRATIDTRWCSLVAKDLFNDDVFIMGSGGDNSGDVKTRLQNALAAGFEADIVIVLVGTNDRNQSGDITAWKSNIDDIVGMIETAGATPVICVPPLPKTLITGIFNMRDYILSKGWQTIRFDYATSVDRDGETVDTDCLVDNAHPSVIGSYRMYQQAIADLHAL